MLRPQAVPPRHLSWRLSLWRCWCCCASVPLLWLPYGESTATCTLVLAWWLVQAATWACSEHPRQSLSSEAALLWQLAHTTGSECHHQSLSSRVTYSVPGVSLCAVGSTTRSRPSTVVTSGGLNIEPLSLQPTHRTLCGRTSPIRQTSIKSYTHPSTHAHPHPLRWEFLVPWNNKTLTTVDKFVVCLAFVGLSFATQTLADPGASVGVHLSYIAQFFS